MEDPQEIWLGNYPQAVATGLLVDFYIVLTGMFDDQSKLECRWEGACSLNLLVDWVTQNIKGKRCYWGSDWVNSVNSVLMGLIAILFEVPGRYCRLREKVLHPHSRTYPRWTEIVLGVSNPWTLWLSHKMINQLHLSVQRSSITLAVFEKLLISYVTLGM